MQLAAAAALGRALLDEHGLQDWSLVFDRAKRRAGICRSERREIGLSAPLTELHEEADVRDTLLHEIAHALVGVRHGHDAVWRTTARRIGCSGERCVRPDAPELPGAWVGTCTAGHQVTRHRRPDRPAACRRCGPAFDLAHLLTWTHHGRTVAMSARYEAQLRRLRERAETMPAGTPGSRPVVVLRPGERARVIAVGRYHGAVGAVVKRGRTRYHLRTPEGVLTVPFELVERAT
ncbi:SprT-like domain-containing protein [Nocardioides dongkuii]|uniref:SprT-like domain-containing protein n=1 Tax=Nocardioides dongkuii TaxID=2760089 RepID=UPI0018787837|nr:SprT-like domain-containing protein [Nocardioides dongkuii]